MPLFIYENLIKSLEILPIEVWEIIMGFVPMHERWGVNNLPTIILNKQHKGIPYKYMGNWEVPPEFKPVCWCSYINLDIKECYLYNETVMVSFMNVYDDRWSGPVCRISIPLEFSVPLHPMIPPMLVDHSHQLLSMAFNLSLWVFNFDTNDVMDIVFNPLAYHKHSEEVQVRIAKDIFGSIRDMIELVGLVGGTIISPPR